MKVDVLINARYDITDFSDEDLPELEMRFLKQELDKLVGPKVEVTFRYERNGKWEVLHG